jgi:hypothetical protein
MIERRLLSACGLGGGVSAIMLHLCGAMQGLDLVVCASSDEAAIKKVSHGCSCIHSSGPLSCLTCAVLLCHARQVGFELHQATAPPPHLLPESSWH